MAMVYLNSRKVFIPLTKLCLGVCHYCTFVQTANQLDSPYLQPEEILQIAKAGKITGCEEALFTLGDKPELRYREAQATLKKLGFTTTFDYLQAMAGMVFEEFRIITTSESRNIKPR